ncbi:hypothetical protein HS125_08900 [bacterium]|nr:hypothetical protein [bacterium]
MARPPEDFKARLIPETELALARMQEELKLLEERIAKAAEDLRASLMFVPIG